MWESGCGEEVVSLSQFGAGGGEEGCYQRGRWVGWERRDSGGRFGEREGMTADDGQQYPQPWQGRSYRRYRSSERPAREEARSADHTSIGLHLGEGGMLQGTLTDSQNPGVVELGNGQRHC